MKTVQEQIGDLIVALENEKSKVAVIKQAVHRRERDLHDAETQLSSAQYELRMLEDATAMQIQSLVKKANG